MAETTDVLANVLHLPTERTSTHPDDRHTTAGPSESNVLAYLKDAFPEAAASAASASYNYPPRGTQPPPPNLNTLTSPQPTVHPSPSHPQPPAQTAVASHGTGESTSEIDPQLTDLAAIAAANTLTGGTHYSTDYNGKYVDYGALGEMGGKRKKMPHERAGWTEMDQEGPRKRGRKKVMPLATTEGGGTQPEAYGLNLNTAAGSNSGTSPDGQAEVKLSRAEQNKRAQQAFRRRREERMKDLEHAVATIPSLQTRLHEVEGKLKETGLSLEAASIEASALRALLVNLSRSFGISILKPDGMLALHPSDVRAEGVNRPEDLDAAFETLARQARELARTNAAGREEK